MKESHLVGNMDIENFTPGRIRFGRTKSPKPELHLVKLMNDQKLMEDYKIFKNDSAIKIIN